MATLHLTHRQKTRVEYEARRRGSFCKACGSPDLLARDTAIGYADGTVRAHLDCIAVENHDAEAELQFDSRAARHLLEITPPGPRA